MKVLIIGSGGREHVLAWKLAKSPKVKKIFAAPGNAGISEIAQCVNLQVEDIEGCLAFAKENNIDLTVVGPEVPLVLGMVDVFEKAGLRVFGPNKKCAQFEGSKAFTKAFLFKHQIPTAAYKEYIKKEDILKDLGLYGYPMVIKADGLAAGKGVLIPETEEEARHGIKMIMEDKEFGEAGDKVVIEEFLTGQEASMLCFVDGKTIVPMESAQDYKRAYDGDEGLNTGGMGTYSPNILFEDDLLNQKIKEKILKPIIDGFIKDNLEFKGILFIGLMIENGEPKVLEFNVRFGDPEAQSVLMRMESDLLEVMEAVIDQKLEACEIKWRKENAVCVVIASGGYPGNYEKGKMITGLSEVENCVVFHAGTKKEGDKTLTNGGRVLCVTALGNNREEAREKAYQGVKKINFEGMEYRKDIAEF
ncbi:MAG: phosphoribosylamine--glycine ligase [Eubacteriaceae bacterium]